MKSFLIDVKKQTAEEVDINDDLDSLYNALNCDCIDVAVRYVGGKRFDIVCDDEGLLKDSPIPSAINSHGEVMLVGNLLFFHHDYHGNFTALSDDDVKNLSNHVFDLAGKRLIIGCEYL